MSITQPVLEQIRFESSKTGSHDLDAYLEAAERGSMTISDLIDQIFNTDGTVNPSFVQWRVNPTTQSLEIRIGEWVDPNAGWTATGEYLFRPRGAWAGTTAYKRLDTVTNASIFYVCKEAHTSGGVFDATKWDVCVDVNAVAALLAGTYSVVGHNHAGVYEPVLGNPGTSGLVLASTTGGVRSWAEILPTLTRSTRTSNTILAAADKARFIDITSGTFTQTLTAAATLGAGWSCYLRNSGTGIITLDPNSSETVDGRTTITIYPGEGFALQCDGTNFYTVGRPRVVKIGSSTVGSAVANVDLELGFGDTELSEIRIAIEGMTTDASVGRSLLMRVKAGGAYDTGNNYGYVGQNQSSGTLTAATQNLQAAATILNASFTSSNSPLYGEIRVLGPNATPGRIISRVFSGFNFHADIHVAYATAAALQGIRLYWAGDNVAAGTFTVWGLR